jgi:hypothetical protein
MSLDTRLAGQVHYWLIPEAWEVPLGKRSRRCLQPFCREVAPRATRRTAVRLPDAECRVTRSNFLALADPRSREGPSHR